MNADAAQMNVLQIRERERLNDISRRVIGSAHCVSSALGHGFLEKVYENALCIEMTHRELKVMQQVPLQVFYAGRVVGDYIPDILVEDCLVLEIKAVPSIGRVQRQQCLNYLREANLRLGLVLNFGTAHLEVGRIVYRF